MNNKQRSKFFLWVFVLLFIILGLSYSILTPIFENSDETLHYPYAKHLADGRGLPLAVPGQLWNQEGTQHPLYYAIVAAGTFWLDTDNLPDVLTALARQGHTLWSPDSENPNLVRLSITVTNTQAFIARLFQLGRRVRLVGPEPIRSQVRDQLLQAAGTR